MKRTKLKELDLSAFPEELHSILRRATVYDSSSSPEARVYFLDVQGGFFLKKAAQGALAKEAILTAYFAKKALSARVEDYLSTSLGDFLLTRRIRGEDGTHEDYLTDPVRLATQMGECLRMLHECRTARCPVPDRMKDYFDTVEENYAKGAYDLSFGSFSSAEDAYRAATEGRSLLKSDTLIHGDYCLPNILFNKWCFSGFIDLGNGGVGDRHVDLFWGAWTLAYNLKTDAYRDRFFDAYGRDRIDPDALLVVSAAEIFG